jgi:hypothetical protein
VISTTTTATRADQARPESRRLVMLASGSQIGKYLLGKKLGQGGFGVVFRAHDASLDREVALKFLTEEHSAQPQVLQRFLQEARSAARIAHPGIVTVYECGQLAEANNAAYIAMELLDGESLTTRLARSGRIAPGDAMEIVRQIASALEAAHRAGIIHRDLKPDNVYLVRDPAMASGERVKVLDFGIAKLGRAAASSVQTQSMMVFGTPQYMSPEQCRSAANVDARSDVYTLGCILFELVCGKPPFAGGPGDLIAQHVLVEAPAASSIAPEISPALDHLIAAMLAKEPDDRPASMAAVQRALEQIGAMAPGVAPTLLPGMLPVTLPTPASFGVRATPTPSRAARPTTLGAAASSAVVVHGPRRSHVRLALAVAGIVAAVGIALAVKHVASGSEQTTAVATLSPDAAGARGEPMPAERGAPSPDRAPAAPEPEPEPEAMSTGQEPIRERGTPRTAERRPPSKPFGILTITAQPPCEVRIDGAAGRRTPVRGHKIAAGRHTITLVNVEHSISETIHVDVAPGEHEIVTRDFRDRIAPPPPPPPPPPEPSSKDRTINPFTRPTP